MSDEMVFIRAGWLIDGSGAAIQKNVQLTMENGMIRSIRKISIPVSGREKSAGRFVDLSECTILPGLIDAHVHLAMASNARRNHQIEQIQIARELKVPIALGTDAGSSGVEHGQSVIAEMRLLMKAGYDLEEVIQCASHNGAVLLGMPAAGLVHKQMPGTLIAVEGNPSLLPGSLNKVKGIFIKGKQII